eukprot:5310163-Amphidinium_carterae.1
MVSHSLFRSFRRDFGYLELNRNCLVLGQQLQGDSSKISRNVVESNKHKCKLEGSVFDRLLTGIEL